jgi:uncharacterized membrane protein
MNLFKKYFFNSFILMFFLFLFNFSFASFHNNYADIDIYLTNDGRISIFGDSNIKEILNISNSYEYTNKKKEYWILNFSTDAIFEEYIFNLHMPKGVEINYIKTTPNFRIVNNDEDLSIIGTGSNSKINIVIQYKLNLDVDELTKNSIFFSNLNFYLVIFFVFIFFFLLLVLFYIYSLNKNKIKYFQDKKDLLEKFENKKNDLNHLKNNLDNLDRNKKKVFVSIFPKRQQDILKILKEREKITQKELEDLILIPKSSISRNVKSLLVKGIIRKEKIGLSNYLFLNNDIKLVFEKEEKEHDQN